MQNFIVFSWAHFKSEYCKFWSNFKFDPNIVSGMGAVASLLVSYHVFKSLHLCNGHLNIKTLSYQYKKSNYKDDTVSWMSYLYNGNTYTWKDSLCIETRSVVICPLLLIYSMLWDIMSFVSTGLFNVLSPLLLSSHYMKECCLPIL